MVEFNGYLHGAAEKAFFKKSRNILLKGYFAFLPMALPVIILGGRILDSVAFIYAFLAFLLIFPLLFFIPKSSKERMGLLPKRIYTDGETIVVIAERYSESKLISDVKAVIDHGEFYELSFPFGKISDKFICQKSLLTKGSLAEFESMFSVDVIQK